MQKVNLRSLLAVITFLYVLGMLILVTMNSRQSINPLENNLPEITETNPSPISTLTLNPEPLIKHEVQFNVIDEETQKPIPYAEVSILESSTNRVIFKEQTDGSGSLSISRSTTTDTVATVTHEQYFPLQNVSFGMNPNIPVTLVMQKKYSIAGKVSDQQRNPIENTVINIKTAATNNDEHASSTVLSDATGIFHLYPLRSGEYIIEASHPNFLLFSASYKAGDHTIEIILRKDIELTVLTVDESHQIISDADVKVLSTNKSKGIFATLKKTNADGIALFESLSPNFYEVEGIAPFSAKSARSTIDCSTYCTTRSPYHLTLTLQKNLFSVSGRVIDSLSNLGIRSATVICQSVESSAELASPTFCITDDLGGYSFKQLPVGKYSFYVDRIAGYISGDYEEFDFYGAKPKTVLSQLIDQDIANYDFYLKPAWKLKGVVQKSDGSALSGGIVRLLIVFNPWLKVGKAGSKRVGNEVTVKLDGTYEIDGEFELDTEGSSVCVVSTHPEYKSSSSEQVVPIPGEIIEGLNIIHEQKFNVNGIVTDTTGNPIDEAYVYFWYNTLESSAENAQLQAHSKTNKKGEYAVYLPSGFYFSRAEAQGYLPSDTESKQRIKVMDDYTQKTVNFTLERGTYHLQGIVINQENVPIGNVSIWMLSFDEKMYEVRNRDVVNASNNNNSATVVKGNEPPRKLKGNLMGKTDKEGLFTIDLTGNLLPMNNTILRITAIPPTDTDYDRKSINIAPDDRTLITITLEEMSSARGEIKGKVLTHEGNPLPNFKLLVIPAFDKYQENVSGDDYDWIPFYSPQGIFAITHLNTELSPFIIAALHPELGLAFSDLISLNPTEVKSDVIIRYDNKIAIRGIVVDENNKSPLHEADIWVQLVTNSILQHELYLSPGYQRIIRGGRSTIEQGQLTEYLPRTRADASGSFLLEGLPGKKLWIFILVKGYDPGVILFDPQPSQNLYDLGEITLRKHPMMR